MSAREITELRKAGKLKEAYEQACALLQANPHDIWVKRGMSWVLYEHLKAAANSDTASVFCLWLQELISLTLPEDDKMIFDNVGWQIGKLTFSISKQEPINYSLINSLLELTKQMHFTKPSEVYSYLLKAFHKAFKDNSDYCSVIDWWGLNNLRRDDFQKERLPSGKEVISLAEQVYIAYAKHLLPVILPTGETTVSKEKIEAFIPLLDELIEKQPQYQYPPYYKAKLLLATGDKRNSLSSLLPFVRRKKNEFWAWDVLSEAFPDDEEKQIACYCRALQCHVSGEFLVNIRQRLARWLVRQQMYREAKTEITLLIKARKENGWRISTEVEQWTKEPWFSLDPLKSNKQFYQQRATLANSLLYADVAEEYVIIEFVNESKKIANFIASDKKLGYFKYDRFLPSLNIGDVVRVRFNGGSKEGFYNLHTLQLSDNLNIKEEYCKTIEGQLQIPLGREFGFLADAFVHPSFIRKFRLKDKQQISALTMKSFNPQKRQWGWKVVFID